MHFEELSYFSHYLQHDVYINRYGHSGVPIVVFPSFCGTHTEYANFEMIEACRSFIDAGKVQFYTVSSIDDVTWGNPNQPHHEIGYKYERYEKAIVEEIVPFIKHKANYFDRVMATGCSMGAYHAVNMFLKHPDVFGKMIALSGVYDVRYFLGDFADSSIYFNSPVDYLPNLQDNWYLETYRHSDVVICTGLGAWEQDGLPSFYRLKEVFEQKNIPAWFDVWGDDVAHDWNWWRIQMPYFLGKMVL